jgi:hypothetical protein
MSTAFVTLCDKEYYGRALRTIDELRTHGGWTGDIVLIAVDFNPEPLPGVEIYNTSHINTDALIEQHKAFPIYVDRKNDLRHFRKLYQWDKLQVFRSFFRRWERIVFLDAGHRVFNPVDPLLDLDWRGKFIAPDDSDLNDNGKRFGRQMDFTCNPAATDTLFSELPRSILDEQYFLNCMFLYDTSLLDRTSFEELESTMNRFPMAYTNEMAIMNLVFTFKLRVWHPLPMKLDTGLFLFGWCEYNYPGSHFKQFHFIKYSITG